MINRRVWCAYSRWYYLTMGKKIYLDDERPTPEGWIGCRWPGEVIAHLEQGDVDVVSLDHDLGEFGQGARTGKDVLTWIMDRVVNDVTYEPPAIVIHSMNPVERELMKSTARRIERIWWSERENENAAR